MVATRYQSPCRSALKPIKVLFANYRLLGAHQISSNIPVWDGQNASTPFSFSNSSFSRLEDLIDYEDFNHCELPKEWCLVGNRLLIYDQSYQLLMAVGV